MSDLVTTSEVATLRGLATADAARTWLNRNTDIICAGRDLASGEKLWPRQAVLAKPRRTRGRPTKEQNTMPTTTLARYGDLDGRTQADGWTAYIRDGGYSDGQTATLVEALLSAQRDEVDDRLPDGCTWQPGTSEILGPVGTDLGEREDIDEVFQSACQAVIGRFDEIETAALGGS